MNIKSESVMPLLFCALLILMGCSKQSSLSEWPPKNPSQEFLNATKVINPFPSETSSDPDKKATDMRFHQSLVPALEFFGALSDEQVNTLSTTKRLQMPYGSLTAKQQTMLKNYFDVYRQIMKDAPVDRDTSKDELADLRNFGAQEDLSNVDILLDIRANNLVRFACIIKKQDGSISQPLPLAGLGTLKSGN